MRWMLTLMVLATAVAAMGCENGQQNTESMRVPPPAPEASGPEPVPDAGASDDTAGAMQSGQQPEPMDDDMGAAGPGSSYTIQEGDTLWSIAQDAYGDGQKWVDIVRANPGLDPEKMAVGQTITLP